MLDKCKSCQFCIQHYRYCEKLGITRVGCYHCENENVKDIKRVRICENYVKRKGKKEEKYYDILHWVNRVEKSLNYYKDTLKEIKTKVSKL